MQKYGEFINTTPTKKDIEEVLHWLKEELDNSIDGCGFYHNKNLIEEGLETNNVIVFNHEGKNIGLALWGRSNKRIVDLDIFVIQQEYRGNGFGETFYKAISDFFSVQEVKVVLLFCEPIGSELFWKKMGLIKLPKYEEATIFDKIYYYDILVKTASTTYKEGMDKIELWNEEIYRVRNTFL